LTLIALSPKVSYELDRLGIPHKTISDYGGSYKRYQEGIQAYYSVEKLLGNPGYTLVRFMRLGSFSKNRYVYQDLRYILQKSVLKR
jgi:hypothetical protein